MSPAASDPYAVLGISSRADDAEIRAAYRRAVQREHPDHNGGSPEAARRFEAVQEAYALIRVRRARGAAGRSAARPSAAGPSPAGPTAGPRTPPPPAGSDPGLEARLADLEREVTAARAKREEARRAAREAERQAAERPDRPSDEELGYIKTDDSFSKILADAASGLLSEAREQRVPERLADLLDELGTKLHERDDPRR